MSAAASNSANGTDVCAPGWRDDNFALFGQPIPCSLYQEAHWGLNVFYFAFYMVVVLEQVVTTALQTNHMRGFLKFGFSTLILANAYLAGYVTFDPLASVQHPIESPIFMVGLFLHTCGVNIGVSAYGVMLVRTANGMLSGQDASNYELTRASRTVIIIHTVNCTINGLSIAALLVLTQTLPDAQSRELCMNLIFILFGVTMFVTCTTTLFFMYKLRVVADKRVEFLTSLPSDAANSSINAMQQLSQRLRVQQTVLMGELPSTLLFILMGSFVRIRYWIFHVILFPLGFPIVLGSLLICRSKLVAWVYWPASVKLLSRLGIFLPTISGTGRGSAPTSERVEVDKMQPSSLLSDPAVHAELTISE